MAKHSKNDTHHITEEQNPSCQFQRNSSIFTAVQQPAFRPLYERPQEQAENTETAMLGSYLKVNLRKKEKCLFFQGIMRI